MQSDGERYSWRERQGSGGTHRGRRLRTEGAGGRDQLVGCYVGTLGVFSQTTEREERGGQEKEEPEMQRLSLGYRLL